jgi:hypothetical protein
VRESPTAEAGIPRLSTGIIGDIPNIAILCESARAVQQGRHSRLVVEAEWRLDRIIAAKSNMKTWITCIATTVVLTGSLAGAEFAWESSSSNYLQLIERPKSQLDPQLRHIADLVGASKVPSRAEALRAVLVFENSDAPYLRDPRLTLGINALYRVGREIPGFASSSDFIWVIHAEMLGSGLVQVFCVSTGTAKVLRLFPELTDRGPQQKVLVVQQTNQTLFLPPSPRSDLGREDGDPKSL